MVIEDFSGDTGTRWQFFTDQVMGGVSEGQARIVDHGGRTALHLTGTVSTANRGGFIQARRDLPEGLPPSATGIGIDHSGDGGIYYIHLRTTRTVLPWQFFQAAFQTGPDWQETRLPFDAFTAKGRGLRAPLRPAEIRSIAIAAYGRDHQADVKLARIATF